MARILSIDFGEKRTGIAVTDPLQMIANGMTTVSTNQLFDFLSSYIKQEEVETIVIGHPKTLQNQPATIMTKIEALSTKLTTIFPKIKIVFVDERFTSVLAQRFIIESGVKKKKRQDKSLIDQISATIILQTYLEQEKYRQ